jgi:hypothetical protein
VNIAELLLYQRADAMSMAMMAMVARQILAPGDLWFMGAPLVALMRDSVVRR